MATTCSPPPTTSRARRRPLLAALVVAALVLSLTGCSPRPDVEAALLADLNHRREAEGLAPLTVQLGLETAARNHAASMVLNGLSHATDLTLGGQPSARRFGENVGRGHSVAAIADALWASPSHRRNILGPYTGVGIGVYQDPDGQYWVAFRFEGS